MPQPDGLVRASILLNAALLIICGLAQIYCYSISCAQDNEIRHYLLASIGFTTLALLNTIGLTRTAAAGIDSDKKSE